MGWRRVAYIRLTQASRNGHDCTREDPLDSDGPHERLEIRRKPEGDGLIIAESWIRRSQGRNEFRTPDISSSAGNEQLVRVSVAHGHDVGQERQRSELVAELPAEEEVLGERRVGARQELEHDRLGYHLLLNGVEDLKLDVGIYELLAGPSRFQRSDDLLEGEHDWIVLVDPDLATVILEDTLQRDVRSVILN